MMKAAAREGATGDQRNGFQVDGRAQTQCGALDPDGDVAAQMCHQIADARGAELRRSDPQRFQRKSRTFDGPISDDDGGIPGDCKWSAHARDAHVQRNNRITRCIEVQAMHLRPWDQEDAAAGVAQSGVHRHIVADGIHDEGRAAEFVEGKEARLRGGALDRQRRFPGLGDAVQWNGGLDLAEQRDELRGVRDEIRGRGRFDFQFGGRIASGAREVGRPVAGPVGEAGSGQRGLPAAPNPRRSSDTNGQTRTGSCE